MLALAVIAVSVGPPIGFILLILFMDRREPEPLGFVMRIIGFGAASGIVAAMVEYALDGLPFLPRNDAEEILGFAGAAIVSFVKVAPVEELCKLAAVLLFAWKSPYFTEENDGIVYTGASAIGFASLENIIYVTQGGISTGVLRAFTAIPLHVFTGVILGMHVGRARFSPAPGSRNLLLLRGFAAAYVIHGLYDTFAMSGSALALLLPPLIIGVSTIGAMTLARGRRLSLARYAEARQGGAAEPAASTKYRAVLGRSQPVLWMAVVSRTILGLCAALWILLALGILTAEDLLGDASDAVLGGALVTFIPVSVAVALELGYRRRTRPARKGLIAR